MLSLVCDRQIVRFVIAWAMAALLASLLAPGDVHVRQALICWATAALLAWQALIGLRSRELYLYGHRIIQRSRPLYFATIVVVNLLFALSFVVGGWMILSRSP
jgi:hypothetical protein